MGPLHPKNCSHPISNSAHQTLYSSRRNVHFLIYRTRLETGIESWNESFKSECKSPKPVRRFKFFKEKFSSGFVLPPFYLNLRKISLVYSKPNSRFSLISRRIINCVTVNCLKVAVLIFSMQFISNNLVIK